MAVSPQELPAGARQIASNLAEVLDASDFDIAVDIEGAAFEVVADEWTLHVGLGTVPVAWLALDSGPDEASNWRDAIITALTEAVLGALARADQGQNGFLTVALFRSGDPLSGELAELLASSVRDGHPLP